MRSDENCVNASKRVKQIETKLHIKLIQLLIVFEEEVKWQTPRPHYRNL